MRKWILAVAAAAIFVAPGIASAQAPILIKFSHVLRPNTPKGKGAEKFKELAEKYTNGKVKVEVYPNSHSLQGQGRARGAAARRSADAGAVELQVRPDGRRDFEVFDLPYLLPNEAALRKVTEGPIGRPCSRSSSRKGMIGLAYWDNGFKEMSANKPLRMPDDLQGPEVPHPVVEGAGGAVPRARRDPAGDGLLGSLSGAADRRRGRPGEHAVEHLHPEMHEVQKYTTLTNHGYIGYVVVVNKKFWDGLPADVRGQLEKAMNEATAYSNKIAATENDEALEEIKKSGKTEIIDPTAAEKAAMRKAMEPLYSDMASRVGKQLIDDVVKTTHGVTN